MKRFACILTGLLAGVGCGADAVFVPLDSVTVPVESVTVPIESVTVSEQSVACSADETARRKELIAVIRGNGSEAERVAALERLWRQDDVFYVLFKPGADANAAVRAAAIRQLAEVEILKAIDGKIKTEDVCKAISERLEAAYAAQSDRRVVVNATVIRQYIHRLRSRL